MAQAPIILDISDDEDPILVESDSEDELTTANLDRILTPAEKAECTHRNIFHPDMFLNTEMHGPLSKTKPCAVLRHPNVKFKIIFGNNAIQVGRTRQRRPGVPRKDVFAINFGYNQFKYVAVQRRSTRAHPQTTRWQDCVLGSDNFVWRVTPFTHVPKPLRDAYVLRYFVPSVPGKRLGELDVNQREDWDWHAFGQTFKWSASRGLEKARQMELTEQRFFTIVP